MIKRRHFLLAAAALSLGGSGLARAWRAPDFDSLRARLGPGGRLGLAAIDLGSGRYIGHDRASRFAMASTFKLALAGMVLVETDAGRLSLGQQLRVSRADLLDHAPRVAAAGIGAAMSLEAACAAIVEVSDNGAANMLLRQIGGPAALTRFFRRCGDGSSRLDRIEPALNQNLPGDPRDTTTPAAMLGTMRALLAGRMLSTASRRRLERWMMTSTRGTDRLRAGLPTAWRAGSKAGTGARGAHNDLAIARPPGRAPILVALYLDGGTASGDQRAAIHRDCARLIATAFA